MLCAGRRRQAANRAGQGIEDREGTDNRENTEDREDTLETEDQLATGQEEDRSEEDAAVGTNNHVVIVDIE